MSRPQFRKRSPDSFRVNSQVFLPSYSGQTGQRIAIAGSSAACARHYMRRTTNLLLSEEATRIVARDGLPPTPESLGRVLLRLEASMRETRRLLRR